MSILEEARGTVLKDWIKSVVRRLFEAGYLEEV